MADYFDVQAALNDGYTPAEIADYLGKDKSFGVDVESLRKNGMSDEDIIGGYVRSNSQPQDTAPGVKAEDPGELSWLDVPGQALKNAPASAWRLAQNLGEAIMHPVDTARAVGDVVVGLKRKGQRYFDPALPVEPEEAAADALIQYGKDRYGSEEGLKRTLAYDLVGALADGSTLLTGGAGAAKGLGTVAKVARLPEPVVAALGRMNAGLGAAARATDPLGVAMRTPQAVEAAAGKARSALGFEPLYEGGMYDAAARKLYRTALGLNTGFSNNGKARFSPAEVQAIVDTGLSEGLPVTRSGYGRTQDKISGLNARIDRAIGEADAAGVTVDPYRVAEDALNSEARQMLAAQSTPVDDLRAFDNAVGEYMDVHGVDNATVGGMQATKKATYRKHDRRYNNNASPMANGAIEGDMELARQQRLEIGRAVDEAHKQGLITDKDWTSIHDLNRKEGSLIDLRDAMERALLKSGNRGMADWFLGSVVGATTGNLGAGAAMATGKQLLTSPWFRSQAALKLHSLGQTGLPSNLHTPVWAAQHFAVSMPQIEDWYRQAYGGILGEMERGR